VASLAPPLPHPPIARPDPPVLFCSYPPQITTLFSMPGAVPLLFVLNACALSVFHQLSALSIWLPSPPVYCVAILSLILRIFFHDISAHLRVQPYRLFRAAHSSSLRCCRFPPAVIALSTLLHKPRVTQELAHPHKLPSIDCLFGTPGNFFSLFFLLLLSCPGPTNGCFASGRVHPPLILWLPLEIHSH